MKVTKQVEQLLRQGRKPRELRELGFSKKVITMVQRKLRKEKADQKTTVPKSKGPTESIPQIQVASDERIEAMEQRLASIESDLDELTDRLELLEAATPENPSLHDIEARLAGTPALGLRHRFECQCGATGLVAVRIRCTNCGRETWWGWHPKQ